jgi:hypothetical protein
LRVKSLLRVSAIGRSSIVRRRPKAEATALLSSSD